MAITTVSTANDILNQVAVEVGLDPVTDPMGSQDRNFVRMKYLLNTAGDELAWAYRWEFLSKQANIDTSVDDSGEYDFPDDFLYITNQTVWERNNRYPVYWLSPQDWQYLEGRQLASETIYAKFRIQEGKFTLYPMPSPVNWNIFYEYTSKNWAKDGTDQSLKDKVSVGSDTPLYDRTLITRYLKVKWMESVGKDTAKAQADFNQLFEMLTAHDKGAPMLSAGAGSRGIPLLDMYRNAPDTGYGGA